MIELTKWNLANALYKGYHNRDLSQEKFDQITNSFKNKIEISKIYAKSILKREILGAMFKANNPVVLHSGGVDSTVMLLLARELYGAKYITACSIGYKEPFKIHDYNTPEGIIEDTFAQMFHADESKISERICKSLDINHITFYIDKRMVQETLDAITKENYKDFFISSSLIPTYHIFKYAKDYGDSIITGDGGDELFCGYDRYLFAYYLSCFRNCRVFATRDFKSRKMQKAKKFLNGGYQDLVSIWSVDDIFKYLDIFMLNSNFEVKLNELDKDLHPLDRMMLFDIGTELFGVETRKVQTAVRMAEVNPNKVISPFLDEKIMNFVASLPIKYKYRWFTRKVLLREIIKDEFPEYSKIAKKGKKGFAFPYIEEKEWTRMLIQNLLDKQILTIIE